MATEHRLEVASSFLSDGYTAHCSCGWNSDEHPDEETALFYGNEHRERATGPGGDERGD